MRTQDETTGDEGIDARGSDALHAFIDEFLDRVTTVLRRYPTSGTPKQRTRSSVAMRVTQEDRQLAIDTVEETRDGLRARVERDLALCGYREERWHERSSGIQDATGFGLVDLGGEG